MEKYVAITGANGFVGRVLCTELSKDGWTVRGIVRTAEAAASLPDSVEPYVLPDMDSIDNLSIALTDCSYVVHLAAKVHDMYSNDLSEYRRVNTLGTHNLAKAAIMAGVKKFIYISTIKVNGERTPNTPFTNVDKVFPQDSYAISKYEAECALREIESESNLEVTIIRPPLVYGPLVKGNLSVLIKWIDKGVILPLAKIKNSRSLLNIYNFTDFIQCCLLNPKAAGETFLLSDDHDVSTSELISDIAHSMNRPARLFFLPRFMVLVLFLIIGKRNAFDRLFDSLSVDISYTKKVMNWEPKYTYHDGIAFMVNRFVDHSA